MEQGNVGQAPITKRSKRLAVKKNNIKNKRSTSIQARVTVVIKIITIKSLKKSS